MMPTSRRVDRAAEPATPRGLAVNSSTLAIAVASLFGLYSAALSLAPDHAATPRRDTVLALHLRGSLSAAEETATRSP